MNTYNSLDQLVQDAQRRVQQMDSPNFILREMENPMLRAMENPMIRELERAEPILRDLERADQANHDPWFHDPTKWLNNLQIPVKRVD